MIPVVSGYSSDSESQSDSNDQLHGAEDQNYANTINSSLQIGITPNPDKKRALGGYIEAQTFDDYSFKRNRNIHNKLKSTESRTNKELTGNIKRQRKSTGDSSITEGKDRYKGPWASYTDSSSDDDLAPNDHPKESYPESRVQTEDTVAEEEEREEEEDEDEEHQPRTLKEEITVFHGSSKYDYQGNSYMYVPRDIGVNLLKEPGLQECYVPKKKLHQYDGHKNGTQHLEFLPNSGHLLLSCGNDNNVLLWDVYHSRELLRGYYGHSRPVKYVSFNNTGSEFISCAYDNWVKVWDTETGKCKRKYKMKGSPNVAKYHPENQNEIIVGLSNQKIEHFDLTSESNDTIQTYDHHMGAINSIEFIDDNKKFVTSSDDKTLRIWNWRINMPIKQIADPSQYSMPFLKTHPNGKYFVAQSMDNNILTFCARSKDKFKKNKKKVFSGHDVSGYSIELGFSPDGKNLMSGDSHGNVMFWDWKTCKLVTTLRVADSIINCVDSSPQESSLVAMGSQQGKIYLYE